ncbi:hypothetical protein FSP39_020980 [Pinctada imbricata]|uniref:MAM domain-containing protein n=1 Tax=Pinctada imbricata TaxID=66713 RepID=A0AA88XXA5_PINIB|nr:hypothetical protein FSP39_020980 [Pinctada imbricata]
MVTVSKMAFITYTITLSLLIKVAQSSNQTAVSLLNCDFEDNDAICGFVQDPTDDIDWLRQRGRTASTNTGPLTDHTYQQQNNIEGHYMYVESSGPSRKGDKARLISSFVNATSALCLKFYYDMYGAEEGTLNVYIQNKETLGTPILSISGNQGTRWKAGIVTIPLAIATGGFEIVFEGVIGDGYHSDIAIDDLSLIESPCQNSQVPFKTCGFETNDPSCGFTQDKSDDFDWTRHVGRTASSGTGPTADHTLGTQQGYYMYTEASGPRRAGDKARLISPLFTWNSTLCLLFYYNLYGLHTGTLNVYVKQGTGDLGRPSVSISGNQGNLWKLGKVNIPLSTAQNGFKVVFEGVIGNGYEGDMAIDDISIQEGQCHSPRTEHWVDIHKKRGKRNNEHWVDIHDKRGKRNKEHWVDIHDKRGKRNLVGIYNKRDKRNNEQWVGIYNKRGKRNKEHWEDIYSKRNKEHWVDIYSKRGKRNKEHWVDIYSKRGKRNKEHWVDIYSKRDKRNKEH